MFVLLLTAVLPMLAVRAVQAVSIYKLQANVAQDMRERLTDQAEQDMLQAVNGYAHSLDQEAQLGLALLKIQAAQVEHRLVGLPQPDSVAVPTVEEFARLQDDGTGPFSIELSERHAIVTGEDELQPLAISYDTQVVMPIKQGALGLDARQDLARLGSMTRIYRDLNDRVDDTILWQYTTLKSGLHFSYPAKSMFPENYQPQDRGWFQRAINANQAIGSRPYVDASTGQLVITFAQPVVGRGRQLAGVTAIDLRVSQLLDPMALNTEWADQSRVMVVAAYPALDEPKQPRRGQFRPSVESDRQDRAERLDRRERIEQLRNEQGQIGERDGQAFELDSEPNTRVVGDNPDLLADTSYPADVYIVADVQQERVGRYREGKTLTVQFDSEADRKAVTKDLLDERSGVRRVSIEGKDRMVAYGRVGGDNDGGRPVFTFIVAPTGEILQPAESAIAEVEVSLRTSLVNTGGILLILLLAVGVIAFFMSFRMTLPIVEMASASRRVAKGDLETRVNINRSDELGELGRAFNEMVPALHDRMKIRESLAVAMQVQQSLLPNNPPKIAGLDIAGHSEYCDETGGDYYDFIELEQLGPDALAIAVGDVTGHGIAAALLMATGRALIRSNASHPGSLGDVFTKVNRQLCDSEFTGRFMTLMYLVVQNRPNEQGSIPIRYLSAGHDPVIVYRPPEDRFIELAGHDIPLGIDADWAFNEQQSDSLRQGDVLVIGTDGIWECFNPQGDQFGKERLRRVIQDASGGSAESIAKAVSRACHAWRGEREQNDDITLVVIKLL